MKKVGIYQQNWGKRGWEQRYIGCIAQILSEDCEVELIHHNESLDCTAYSESMDLDLSRISFRFQPRPEIPDWSLYRPGTQAKLKSDFCREYSKPYNLFLTSGNEPPIFCHACRGIFFTTFPRVTFDEYFGYTQPEWKERGFFSRWWRMKCHQFEWRARFASYHLVLCPSFFVRQWCWRRWQLLPQVLAPVPGQNFQSSQEKKPVIVSVGTFSALNWKRQDLLISAFQEFYDKMLWRFELNQDWKLVLMGYCSNSEEDLEFVEKLRAKAYGYPIEILTNVEQETLRNTLAKAIFFWSANGYEMKEDERPERLDSFVLTALEAQAAGAIPMIFHAGSAAEVIHHGMNGFLWSTFRELVEMTTAILVEERIIPILETGALKNAEAFNMEAFRERVKKL